MEKILTIMMAVFVISYICFMKYLRKKVKDSDDGEFNLSVASYTPNIKPGNCSLKLTKMGADSDATLATANRFAPELLQSINIGDIIVDEVSVYTAEDLLFELRYIGADGQIINK